MNLNMIRPKNTKEHFLLSTTKNCETLFHQTHRKTKEALEFKMSKPRETFHFNPPIQIKEYWMIVLTNLDVYNSIFNITEKNKFEVYKFPDEKSGVVSYEKVRDESERYLDVSDITAADLQDEIIAPIIIKEYRGQVTKRLKDAGYMIILAGHASSVFQEFQNFLRTEIDLVEVDFLFVLIEYDSSFGTYELQPGIYTFNDLSESVFNILQLQYPASSNLIVIEFDDNTMKFKLVVSDGIIAIRFDEK